MHGDHTSRQIILLGKYIIHPVDVLGVTVQTRWPLATINFINIKEDFPVKIDIAVTIITIMKHNIKTSARLLEISLTWIAS